MARMIPAVIDARTLSPAEPMIFDELRNDPVTKSWTVLHSLDIARHVRQTFGESDFVVLIPNEAVICLEVKGHKRIRRIDGAWYMGSDLQPDYRGPFKQAHEAMESIRGHLQLLRPDLHDVPLTWAVIFPFVEAIEKILPNEWFSWQCITSAELTSATIGELLLNVAQRERSRLAKVPTAKWFNPKGSAPTSKQCNSILEILRPDFELCETPLSIRTRREDELQRYTREQFSALDAMESNDRVIFEGPAGTGKTVLALEAARREAFSGKRVLMLCYNRLLLNKIQEEAREFIDHVETRTIHGLLLELADVQVPSPAHDQREFWRVELPDAALERLMTDNTQFEHDVLIIDEAQDVLREAYLNVLDLLVNGGWADGRWRIFGDFENQAIYGNPEIGMKDLRQRAKGTPTYSLRINCRNSPRITEFIQLLGGLSPGYARVLRPDNHVVPSIRYFRNAAKQHELLRLSVAELLDEGFSAEDIVVLSSRNDGSCASTIDPTQLSLSLRSVRDVLVPGALRFGTIHAFKGLESAAVILTDVYDLLSAGAQSVFYTGITRATDRLHILASETIRKDVIDILTPGKGRDERGSHRR